MEYFPFEIGSFSKKNLVHGHRHVPDLPLAVC